jgi:hypothetical protein
MKTSFASLGKLFRREKLVGRQSKTERPRSVEKPPIEIAPDDPIVAYFQQSNGVVDI